MTNWRLDSRRSGRGYDYDTPGITYDMLGVLYDYLKAPVVWTPSTKASTTFSLQQKTDAQSDSTLIMPLFGMLIMGGGSSITNWSLQAKN